MKTKFISQQHLAADIYCYTFEKPPGFRYIAGQFVELKVSSDRADERGEKRWFTLSSSPTEDFLAITTRQLPSPSSFKTALSQLTAGDHLQISEPMGDFVLPRDTKKPLLFVAGGIGVTPYRSMCKYLQDTGQSREVVLVYAAQSADAYAYEDLLAKTAQLHKITGSLELSAIKQRAEKLTNPAVYLSGPEPLIEKLYDGLKGDFSQSQLLRDYFPNYTYDAN